MVIYNYKKDNSLGSELVLEPIVDYALRYGLHRGKRWVDFQQ